MGRALASLPCSCPSVKDSEGDLLAATSKPWSSSEGLLVLLNGPISPQGTYWSSLIDLLVLFSGAVGPPEGNFLPSPFAAITQQHKATQRRNNIVTGSHLVRIHCQGKKGQLSATKDKCNISVSPATWGNIAMKLSIFLL